MLKLHILNDIQIIIHFIYETKQPQNYKINTISNKTLKNVSVNVVLKVYLSTVKLPQIISLVFSVWFSTTVQTIFYIIYFIFNYEKLYFKYCLLIKLHKIFI